MTFPRFVWLPAIANNDLSDCPVFAEQFWFAENPFVCELRWQANHIHQVVLNNAHVLERLTVSICQFPFRWCGRSFHIETGWFPTNESTRDTIRSWILRIHLVTPWACIPLMYCCGTVMAQLHITQLLHHTTNPQWHCRALSSFMGMGLEHFEQMVESKLSLLSERGSRIGSTPVLLGQFVFDYSGFMDMHVQ